jgi:hypothetical protein
VGGCDVTSMKLTGWPTYTARAASQSSHTSVGCQAAQPATFGRMHEAHAYCAAHLTHEHKRLPRSSAVREQLQGWSVCTLRRRAQYAQERWKQEREVGGRRAEQGFGEAGGPLRGEGCLVLLLLEIVLCNRTTSSVIHTLPHCSAELWKNPPHRLMRYSPLHQGWACRSKHVHNSQMPTPSNLLVAPRPPFDGPLEVPPSPLS